MRPLGIIVVGMSDSLAGSISGKRQQRALQRARTLGALPLGEDKRLSRLERMSQESDPRFVEALNRITQARGSGEGKLNLSRMGLSMLPAELCRLSELHTLHVQQNELTVLPASLGQLSALQTLDAGSNKLEALP